LQLRVNALGHRGDFDRVRLEHSLEMAVAAHCLRVRVDKSGILHIGMNGTQHIATSHLNSSADAEKLSERIGANEQWLGEQVLYDER
jgi:dGTP triphosphohydrolase